MIDREYIISDLNKTYSLEKDKQIQKDYYKVQEQVKYIDERMDFLTHFVEEIKSSGYKKNTSKQTDILRMDYSKLSLEDYFDTKIFELNFTISSVIASLHFQKERILCVFINKLIYKYKIITPELYYSKYCDKRN